MFQYDLGYGTTTIASTEKYNDGEWQLVRATRDLGKGLLYINEEIVASKTANHGRSISVTDKMYFGGYPGKHAFSSVTNVDFDGCIDDVYILGTPVDLSDNKKAVGVTPGCQDKVSIYFRD